MKLSQSITDLITAYKEMPNGEWRNKTISHLKDAYASALIVESEFNARFGSEPEQVHAGDPRLDNMVSCICPTGAVDNACLVHGR